MVSVWRSFGVFKLVFFLLTGISSFSINHINLVGGLVAVSNWRIFESYKLDDDDVGGDYHHHHDHHDWTKNGQWLSTV